jgi:hypothetical protein
MKSIIKKKIFKSAVAFFFLFFLHGASIGTRQQGISYNVLGLCEGRASRHESSNLAQCLIVAQMFNKPLMPCFCKTLVIRCIIFFERGQITKI